MFSELLSMGSKLLGGLMNQNSQENANAANQALQQTQMAYQHEANTHGVRWKVADAIAAGLHPLAALGVSPASGFSASVGRQEPETGMGDAVSGMGQNIERAINATRTRGERDQAYDNKIRALTLERGELQNTALRAQIARLAQNQNPSFPGEVAPGTRSSDNQVKPEPSEDTSRAPGNPAHEAGSFPSQGWEDLGGGRYAPAFSKINKERSEDDTVRQLMFNARSLLAPTLSSDYRKPPTHIPLKEGHEWRWHPLGMYYSQRPKSGRTWNWD